MEAVMCDMSGSVLETPVAMAVVGRTDWRGYD